VPSAPVRGQLCQTVDARVAEGALLAVLPDPVTCFAGARYTQRQSFSLAPGGSLVLVDWLTCGRRALGETWALSSYQSSNRLFWGEHLVTLEQVRAPPRTRCQQEQKPIAYPSPPHPCAARQQAHCTLRVCVCALLQLHLSSQNLLGVPLALQLQGVHALGLLLLAG